MLKDTKNILNTSKNVFKYLFIIFKNYLIYSVLACSLVLALHTKYPIAITATTPNATDTPIIVELFWANFSTLGDDVTAGLEAAGFEAAGLEAAGLEAAGLEAAGLEAAGLEAAGLEAAGLGAAGLDKFAG